MTYPYPPPRARSGLHPVVWVAIAVAAVFMLLLLVAIAIPVIVNARGGPSGPGPVPVVAPNVGASALTVGQVRHGRSVDESVLAVRKLPVRRDRPSPRGTEWLGIQVSICWHADASAQTAPITWQNWVALDASGHGYLPRYAYADYPRPQLPRVVSVAPGSCAKGWVGTPVPAGGSDKIAQVDLVADGAPVAEWVR